MAYSALVCAQIERDQPDQAKAQDNLTITTQERRSAGGCSGARPPGGQAPGRRSLGGSSGPVNKRDQRHRLGNETSLTLSCPLAQRQSLPSYLMLQPEPAHRDHIELDGSL